jgi:hypothetical protein
VRKPTDKTIPVKPKKLNLKQKKLIKEIVGGKTQKAAAKTVGYSETYASEILKKPEVVVTIQDLMSSMGLSDGALLIKHKELLNAQKQISGVRDSDSGSIEFIEVPDHQVQFKALEAAYKLKGAFSETVKIEVSDSMAEMMKSARERAGLQNTP